MAIPSQKGKIMSHQPEKEKKKQTLRYVCPFASNQCRCKYLPAPAS